MMTLLQTPMVSVQMVVYNGEKYVAETIESILQQTFTDFEFIIVDDGSTDTTPQILQRYAALDPRLILLRNQQNRGISIAHNCALAVARGRYIAITDADDLSMPDRLYKQVAFLDKHSEVGIVGTNTCLIDSAGQALHSVEPSPILPGLARWILFFRCRIVHPSTMVRRAIYQQVHGYDPLYPNALDYDFWLRAAAITQLATLPDVLLARRIHPTSETCRYRQRQQDYALLAQQSAISAFLGKPIALDAVRAVSYIEIAITLCGFYQGVALLLALYGVYVRSIPLSVSEQRQLRIYLSKQLCYLLLKACRMPQLTAAVLGSNFTDLNRFANFMRL